MNSSEGRYQETLEDSARWLSMASASPDKIVSSRSTPSAPANMGTDVDENSSIADEPSSMSSVTMTSQSGDDDNDTSSVTSSTSSDDIESRISFLHQKQLLLERAMKALRREEMYTASIAKFVTEKVHPSTIISPLWEEARTTLKSFNRDEDAISTTSSKGSKRKETECREESSKRIKIDISTVSRIVSSADALIGTPAPVAVSEDEADEAEPYPVQGKWMAKSFLRHHKPSYDVSKFDNWKIKRDPFVGSIVMPPSPTPFLQETELKDALAFTSTPQLITSAVPPFNIVHANAAFAMLSGRSNTVGSSVESIFEVDDVVESSADSQHTFPNQIRLNGKTCQIELTPILDRAQKSKGGVSHLLLQVHEGDAIAMNDIPLSSIAATQGIGNNNRVFLTTIG
ncbi:unnamed protein product [Cylindrotheca closterium]|uniref:Uncharacterized protein n=1 Tax=Cylindrotheca closterium TaxID=2856 RepID=A0AAD2FXB3_9STRA|nr:unnamed protein product [Cylindrotheca closterium]